MKALHRILGTMALATLGLAHFSASSAVVADWGSITTPITSTTTFSFAQYDITHNFTDQYTFSLQGDAGAAYAVTFNFDPCGHGCGSPDINYGIYDANGNLYEATRNTVLLTSGDYVFQVKGTGMGAGNTVDYAGSVTFNVASNSVVSAIPEPDRASLMLCGLVYLVWLAKRRSPSAEGPTGPSGWSARIQTEASHA